HKDHGTSDRISLSQTEQIYLTYLELFKKSFSDSVRQIKNSKVRHMALPLIKIGRCNQKFKIARDLKTAVQNQNAAVMYVLTKEHLARLKINTENVIIAVTDCRNTQELVELQSTYGNSITIASQGLIELFGITCVPVKITISGSGYEIESL
ncbi:MAG: hypothetical protein HY606_14685, partial [Planctomycetes bacterium]|nr:hypothetical protein [Planctomycetota bacterium]